MTLGLLSRFVDTVWNVPLSQYTWIFVNIECHRLFNSLGQQDWHTFSRPHGPLAPSISHSGSVLYIPLHCPTTVLLAISWSFPINFTMQEGVCWCSIRSHHMSKRSELFLNDLQQRASLPSVPCNSRVYLHIGRMRGVMHRSATSFCGNARVHFYWSSLRVRESQAYKYWNIWETLMKTCVLLLLYTILLPTLVPVIVLHH